ncbi:MAG: metallophosphoesterase family protein [Anaerolineales bacterium]|nr:metallophosphoesterase family protein [Anaerolineales bacterium]
MILGVISDTHVPDRARCVSPRALEIFRQAGVEAILHAGDISTQAALDALGAIAPVYAVCGNRDMFTLGDLPAQRRLDFEGVRIGLTHGHGTLGNYITEKFRIILLGLDAMLYARRALAAFPDVDVVVFGHIHMPVNRRVGQQLVFNPGAACCFGLSRQAPSVGLLTIRAGGVVEGRLVAL